MSRPKFNISKTRIAKSKCVCVSCGSDFLAYRSDTDKAEIVCGKLRFTLLQLSTAIKALGFKLVKIKEV